MNTLFHIGNRIDNVLLYKGIVFLLEFKVGAKNYLNSDIVQATDYALDLSCFHKESHNKLLVPILISTRAPEKQLKINILKDNILETYCCNEYRIKEYIKEVCNAYSKSELDPLDWINSLYMPTPTIIEAAQALYMGHNVEDISRNDASAKNLNQTTKATIVCLIGGGQEINKGESAGIIGWFDSLKNNHPDWDVYISDKITDAEYSKGKTFDELAEGINYKIVEDLHLSVSLRSFRSENVAAFVKALLDVDVTSAKDLYEQFKSDYPICITRDLETAKAWVRSKAKGSQRYGLTASSGAKRLRKYGVWVQNKVDAPNWFLNGKDDVRASCFLEETATEFDIQGLELDWTILCWDANLRYNNNHFEYFNFNGTKWQNVNKEDNILYLKNAYRVLLTRARQGLIIFVPTGDSSDITMQPTFYDKIYNYFKEIGIQEVAFSNNNLTYSLQNPGISE